MDPGPKKTREGGVGCIPREKIPSNPSLPKDSEGSGGDPGSRIQGMQIPQREFLNFPREIRRERNRKRLFRPFLGSTIREKNLGFVGAAPSPPESSREFSPCSWIIPEFPGWGISSSRSFEAAWNSRIPTDPAGKIPARSRFPWKNPNSRPGNVGASARIPGNPKLTDPGKLFPDIPMGLPGSSLPMEKLGNCSGAGKSWESEGLDPWDRPDPEENSGMRQAGNAGRNSGIHGHGKAAPG